MLTIARRHLNLPLAIEKWFATQPRVFDAFVPCKYIQTASVKNWWGFARSEFATLVIDLTQTENELQAAFDKNVLYEARRAERDGVKFEASDDWLDFLHFYNEFATYKGLDQLSSEHFSSRRQYAVLLRAVDAAARPVVMHVYILDRALGRCRLLYSASQLHASEDKTMRAFIGRANRFLHWNALLYFKGTGFLEFDFGGYALNTNNQSQLGINAFKASFGGRMRVESNYISWMLYGLNQGRRLLNVIASGAKSSREK